MTEYDFINADSTEKRAETSDDTETVSPPDEIKNAIEEAETSHQPKAGPPSEDEGWPEEDREVPSEMESEDNRGFLGRGFHALKSVF
jgi:hypothetical protein